MRLWSLHPRHLDPPGLVALWREALLARAVLRGLTRGYRHHPQLARFQAQADPTAAIDAYLAAVHAEASARRYRFDPGKFDPAARADPIAVADGQLALEAAHLRAKLAARSPAWCERWPPGAAVGVHPLFFVVPGPVAPWEKAA